MRSRQVMTREQAQRLEYLEMTPEYLRECLNYCHETGSLTWKERPVSHFPERENRSAEHTCNIFNSCYALKTAFTSDNGCGYLTGALDQRSLKSHRVAWAIFHGHWPTGHIDHINGNRKDNRISNLRDVAQSANNRNRCVSTNNTSGDIGVSWRKDSRKWVAFITHNGKRKHLGTFASRSDAVSARKSAESSCGFHKNHGRPSIHV